MAAILITKQPESVSVANGEPVSVSVEAAGNGLTYQWFFANPNSTYSNAYTYENDHIKTVAHNTTSDTSNNVTYTFGYDSLGRKTTVKVGSQVLSTNVYGSGRNSLLSRVDYGNGGKVSYAYDDFDRLIGVRHDGDTANRLAYEYGANGQVAQVTHAVDANTTRVARTDYDLAIRPCQTILHETVGSTKTRLYKTLLKYDTLNNLSQFAEDVKGETHTTGYTYDRDNRVTQIAYDGTAHKVKYTYDALGRVATRVVESGVTAGKLTSTYSYVSGGYGTNSTTSLVAKIAQEKIPFEYKYDSRGNIISEKRGSQTTTYKYDALGQLVRVNDPHELATWIYTYDRGGNILSKTKYAYTSVTPGTPQKTFLYSYDAAGWKDKLTAYDGQTITYDAIGNPLNDGTWSYTWEIGRQLKQMSKSGTTVAFKYDHNGLRTEKKVTEGNATTTTSYVLHGKLVTHMTVGTDELHFFYDAQSRPAKVSFNGVIYTYIHNLQGDIVGLLDSAGGFVVEYKYDAWGRPTFTTGSLKDTLGKLNPFRYRGYVYDEETGLYYLRSRYYNPVWGRFVSADSLLGKVGVLGSHNLFTSCGNNPVMLADPEGNFPQAVKEGWRQGSAFGPLGALVGAAALGLAWLLMNPPSIPLPRINTSSTSTAQVRTESELKSALLSATACSASTRDHSYNTEDYYFAFVVSVAGFGGLVYLNEPLTLAEAQIVAASETLMETVSYSFCNGALALGIYTDMDASAYNLANSFGHTPKLHNHYDGKYAGLGEYYNHYHIFRDTGAHVWFGPPTAIILY